MKIFSKYKGTKTHRQKGFSLPELFVVLIIIAIIGVIALPQILAARRMFRFSGMQRQMVSTLIETRQQAMSQRKPITFRYDDSAKRIIIYGGTFGAVNDPKNRIETLYGSGVNQGEIIYGRPAGASAANLGDGSNLTVLSGTFLDITFQADGSVIDAGNNPVNGAMFLYHGFYQQKTAFAISILGAGGRVKLWRYSPNVNSYVE